MDDRAADGWEKRMSFCWRVPKSEELIGFLREDESQCVGLEEQTQGLAFPSVMRMEMEAREKRKEANWKSLHFPSSTFVTQT